MSLKEEELQKAKEVSIKFETELKEITLKHASVKDKDTNTFLNALLPTFSVAAI